MVWVVHRRSLHRLSENGSKRASAYYLRQGSDGSWRYILRADCDFARKHQPADHRCVLCNFFRSTMRPGASCMCINKKNPELHFHNSNCCRYRMWSSHLDIHPKSGRIQSFSGSRRFSEHIYYMLGNRSKT